MLVLAPRRVKSQNKWTSPSQNCPWKMTFCAKKLFQIQTLIPKNRKAINKNKRRRLGFLSKISSSFLMYSMPYYRRINSPNTYTAGQKIFKKSRKKTREIAFLAVLNFFPVEKLIFGHIFKIAKMEFGQKKISWDWFICFHEFFWPGLFEIFWPTVR